jgi:endonuclease I
VPSGYYDGTENLNGENLRTALFMIIKDHTSISYAELWSAFIDTDKKTNGKVWDMYSDNPGGTPPYEYTFGEDQCGNYGGEAYCYNREHSFPKSWFNDGYPMYTDLFHLYPTDGYVNGRRSNYPYGKVGSADWTSRNGSKVGRSNYNGYSGIVFEPIDEYKGDFARTYFYMLTRYMDKISQWDSDMLSGSNFSTWAKNMLLEWHRNDPVSQKEIDRNNAVYSYQYNRNPFIDNPYFANKIWDPNFVGNPELIITYPQSGIVINTNEIRIEFHTVYFNLGEDGKIECKFNDNEPYYITESPATISGLNEGNNTVNLQLVDNSGLPLTPPVIKELQIIYEDLNYVSSLTENTIFDIYPIPASDYFQIDLNNYDINVSSIWITDITGKQIFYSENFNNKEKISIENKESGIYFISVKFNSGEIYTKKFVIMNFPFGSN